MESVVEKSYADKAVSDKAKLVGDFPEVVWCTILSCLDNCTLQNVLNSSLYFRDLWSSKRTTLLFEQVWKLLKEYLVEEEDTPDVIRKCESCGQTRDIGSFEDYWILNARRVCKTWCKVIDSEYECDQRCQSTWAFSKNFTRSGSAHLFLKHFAASHGDVDKGGRSPFVGGSIELELRNLEERAFVHEMLCTYGRFVKDCMITDGENMTFEFYAELVEWSKLMPNLIDFKLNFLEVYPDDLQLKEVVKSTPMYQFAFLKHLHVSGVPYEVLSEIISKNSHVEILSLDDISSPEKIDLNIFEELDLKELFFQCMRTSEYAMLEQISTSPNLKKLDLQIFQVYVPWQRLFRMLEEKWGSSVEEVKLHLPTAEIEKEEIDLMKSSPSLRLNLVNVKTLWLELNNFANMDLILPMKEKLETLNIKLDYIIKDKSTMDTLGYLVNSQVLLILDHQFRLYASNVWARFPKLQTVVYDMRIRVTPDCMRTISRFPDWLQRSHMGKVYRRSTWLNAK